MSEQEKLDPERIWQLGRGGRARVISAAILAEYKRARSLYGPMRSTHEGYAVILEELDEAWDEIKADNFNEACHEMVQVAAMALGFLVDLQDPRRSE